MWPARKAGDGPQNNAVEATAPSADVRPRERTVPGQKGSKPSAVLAGDAPMDRTGGSDFLVAVKNLGARLGPNQITVFVAAFGNRSRPFAGRFHTQQG